MVWKRKVVGENEQPKKRGRPRKNSLVEEVKVEVKVEVKTEVKAEATIAAAPIEINVSNVSWDFRVWDFQEILYFHLPKFRRHVLHDDSIVMSCLQNFSSAFADQLRFTQRATSLVSG